MQKLVSIHHLRGVAALGVLVFHAVGFVAGYGSGRFSTDSVRIGEAGVDVFFVISGFILTLVTQTARSRGEFILGRLSRVGVPYWVVILALAAMTLILPSAFRNFTWAPQDLLLSLLFVPSLLRDGSIFPLLEPGWTLSLEMLFYLVLAAALGLTPRLRSVMISGVLILLAVLGLALHLPQGQSIAWFFTQAIIVEFCFGIALAQLYLSGWRSSALPAILILMLGCLGFALAAQDPPEAFARARVLIYGIPATLFVGGALFLETANYWRQSRIMTWLGDISYSLYLTHVLVLAVAAKLLAGRIGGAAGDIIMLILAMAAALVAASMFHHIVERPALRLASLLQARKRRTAQAPVRAPAL